MTDAIEIINQNSLPRRRNTHSQTTTCAQDGQKFFREIPSAHIPVYPVLSLDEIRPFSSQTEPSVFDNSHILQVTLARYAIYHALKDMNIQDGDEVLLPCFHCTAMVTPLIEAGAKPVFYKVDKNLNADLDDLSEKITPRTRAALCVNYFGFIQNREEFRRTCDAREILMIEDCAHSLYGAKDDVAVGSIGDYAVGSSYKFYGTNEGGVLIAKDGFRENHDLTSPSFKQAVKRIYNLIEKSLQYGRLGGFSGLFRIFEKLRPLPPLPPLGYKQDLWRENLDQTNIHTKLSGVSKFLQASCPAGWLVEKRRSNYLYLLEKLSATGITPLFPALPDGTVPYMLPIYIDNLEDIFPALEDAGLAMLRFGQFLWDDPAVQNCAVSQDYANNLLQLPCHQSLTKKELDWSIETLRKTINEFRHRVP